MNINDIATKADIDKIIDALEEIKESLKAAPKEKPVLRSADVKKLLNISDSTLQRLRISGKLPCSENQWNLVLQFERCFINFGGQ